LDQLPNYPDGEAWGYATSRDAALQQLQLRAKYVELVLQRGSPLPELKKACPYIVTGWNATKHGVDTPCKLLSDASPQHKKCAAPKMLFLRDLRYRAYNGMQMWRLLETYPHLSNIKSYKEFKLKMRQQVTFHETIANLVSLGIDKATFCRIDPAAGCSDAFKTPPVTPQQNSKKRGMKRKQCASQSPVPTKAGGHLKKPYNSNKKSIRFRRKTWSEDAAGSLTNKRLSQEKKHNQIHAKTLAEKASSHIPKDGRGRCIVCCEQCMGNKLKVTPHDNPWGFKTARACDYCAEYLCTNKKKAKWDGRTCWEVWHEDVELPKLKCAENSKCT